MTAPRRTARAGASPRSRATPSRARKPAPTLGSPWASRRTASPTSSSPAAATPGRTGLRRRTTSAGADRPPRSSPAPRPTRCLRAAASLPSAKWPRGTCRHSRRSAAVAAPQPRTASGNASASRAWRRSSTPGRASSGAPGGWRVLSPDGASSSARSLRWTPSAPSASPMPSAPRASPARRRRPATSRTSWARSSARSARPGPRTPSGPFWSASVAPPTAGRSPAPGGRAWSGTSARVSGACCGTSSRRS
mmetsp:Transcript_56957/g.159850  ORF Transcript_56957/g.159850 Transcript_56957/m.159850 type:complete len:250 (+) Transcript_56957:146-895(+)